MTCHITTSNQCPSVETQVRTLDLARNYDKRRFPWMVNGTFTGYAFSQQAAVAGDSPPPIVLLEFGVNGVSWVDVLLRRLRARWPRAILVYVDLTSLYSWRKSAGWPQDFVWNEAWEKAPTCTTQMQGWLQSTGTEFWSMRSELRRRGVSYGKATGVYYFGDKKHLKQAGHTMIGKGVADLVEAGIRLAKQQGRSSSSVDEVHQGRAAAAAMARQQHTNELCFLWYRSGLIDPRLRVRMLNGGADGVGSTPAGVVGGGGRSFATRLTAASSAARDDDWRFDDFSRRARMRGELGTREEGKFAFLLDSARNATPLGRATATSALSLAFETRVNHSAVFAAFMLDCCIYGSARATLDGKPFGPTLHGSSPGFQHHVLHAQRLGSVEQAGHHRLTVRLVRASPTGAQRFRLGGLFVVPEPASGRDYETEYVWIVPRYAKEGA